jgi:hypothetical protein
MDCFTPCAAHTLAGRQISDLGASEVIEILCMLSQHGESTFPLSLITSIQLPDCGEASRGLAVAGKACPRAHR